VARKQFAKANEGHPPLEAGTKGLVKEEQQNEALV
jgi:hypothetical protein